MSDFPLVSIIVPIYNVSVYLRECVDSLLAQTYTHIEIILVDDGSPDDCGTICDEYAAFDSRIRVIHQENRGVSAARNAGLNVATGKYIQFVDPDDYVAPRLTEVLVEMMDSHDVQLAICSYTIIRDDSEIALFTEADSFIPGTKNAEKFAFISSPGAKLPDVAETEWGSPWARLFLRAVIESQGLRFETGLPFHQDSFFMMEYCSKIRQVRTATERLYFYRQRAGSTWNRRVLRPDAFDVERFFYGKCVPLLRRWEGLSDSERKEAFRHLYYFYADKIIWFLFRFASYSTNRETLRKIRMLCGQPEFQRALRHYRPRQGHSKTVPLFFRMHEPLLVLEELRRHLKRK